MEKKDSRNAGNQESRNAENTADKVLLERIGMITSQNQSSEMPGAFSRKDYIQAAAIMVICLCAVVAGAFLGN